MKIIHADTDDLENPLRGGQPVRTYAINSRLSARHDITVLTSVYKGCRRRLARQGVKYRRLGVRVPGVGLSPHLSFLSLLGPVVASKPHDLVVEEFNPPIGFCGLPWWTSKPVVLIVQWYFFEQWEKHYRIPFRRIMKRVAASGRYRHVIVQTNAMQREIEPFLPAATFRKIPCGIDDEAFLKPDSCGEYVLYLGRLDLHHKGLDLLIEAWDKVCAIHKLPLVIAGEGPARPYLERWIAEKRLEGQVRLVGRVEGNVKRATLAKARFLVMPSRYETFGIAGAEAMAAAKPVICFNIDHLSELLTPDWADLVSPFDTSAFGHAILDLWSNQNKAFVLGARAQERARDYHWDSIARQQEDFYLEIASQYP